MLSQSFTIIKGEIFYEEKKLFSAGTKFSNGEFVLIISDSLYSYEYKIGGKKIRQYQNIDTVNSEYIRNNAEMRKDILVPMPLKLGQVELFKNLQSEDTLIIGNKLQSELLDSVNWSFHLSKKWMKYFMKAHLGSDFQETSVQHLVYSIKDTLWDVDVQTQGNSINTKEILINPKTRRNVPSPQSNYLLFDSLYNSFNHGSNKKGSTVVFWYKGCFACTKLMLELNQSDVPDESIVLINPVDNKDVATDYLTSNNIRFKNICTENINGVDAYPTSIFKCPADDSEKICHQIGYSKEIFESLIAAITFSH